MKRNELDPEAIIWLPRTKTHSEHLNQYSHIDVALDCFLMVAAQLHVSLFGWEYLLSH